MIARSILLAVVFAAGVAVGAVTVLFLPKNDSPRQDNGAGWLPVPELRIQGEDSNLSYSKMAHFDADIQLPEVTGFYAKAKFLRSVEEDGALQLGYFIHLSVAKLDTSKIPEKYRKSKTETIGTREFTWLPTETVFYEVHPRFALFDKDGFPLMELSGKVHTVSSGETNHIQDVAQEWISQNVANRVAKVVPFVVIGRCVTCK